MQKKTAIKIYKLSLPILTILATTCLSRVAAQSPNLTGTWKGGLGQIDKRWVFGMTLTLKQEGNIITGTSKIATNDGTGAYAIHNIKGEVNGNDIQLLDLTLREENNYSGYYYWCKKIYIGKLTIKSDSIFLSGDWNNDNNKIFHNLTLLQNSSVNCPPGSFSVAKVFKKETALTADTGHTGTAPLKRIIGTPKNSATVFLNRKVHIKNVTEVAADSLELNFYDNCDIDGDTITVFYNRTLLLSHQRLSDKPLIIKIAVNSDVDNELLMYADNEGSIPPNTALLIFYDGVKRREITTGSNTKSSGTIVLRKKSK